MRGIRKPRRPSDAYPNGQAQVSLRQAENAYLAALPTAPDPVSFARSEFDQLDKPKLRAVMYREQRSLCIFCERRVSEGHPTPRIDHWYPLSCNPNLALQWTNLHLSCSSLETCDSAKDNHPFAAMPLPVNFRYEDFVGFTSGGEIYVRSDVPLPNATRQALKLAIEDFPAGPQLQRSIINLNHPALVAARAAQVDAERTRLQKAFRNTTATRVQRNQRATQLLGQHPRPAFVSIRVAWLRKTLGRGR